MLKTPSVTTSFMPSPDCANLSSTAAQALLISAGITDSLRTIQQKIYDSKQPSSFPVGNATIAMTTQVVKIYSPTANVAGLLEGESPELVVIGAHFDHLGWGGTGSGEYSKESSRVSRKR